MTLADVKTVIDAYLMHDQPSVSLAVMELRVWLRDRQVSGEVHSFSVRSSGNIVIVDVQTTQTSMTHTLHFNESKWMKPGNSPKRQVNLVPSRKKVVERRPDTPADAYDRAMRGV